MSFFFAVFLFLTLAVFSSAEAALFGLLISDYPGQNLGLYLNLDSGSMVFGAVVFLVVSQVYVYSSGYMFKDAYSYFFWGPLSAFIFSMALLIFSGDICSMFIAWDGLGLSSFLLVSYYSKVYSSGCGLITILMNRFGDAFFILGLSGFLLGMNDFVFFEGAGCLFFFFCAFSKSAQFPLFSWLPSAMAAPTPISSLVHSSTLVTAGVYMMMRLEISLGDYFFYLTPIVVFTYIVSCLDALVSEDLKRIIAMSTLSNLSLMFLSLFLGYWSVCLFHLCSHAMFKSLAFLCAGNFIMGTNHSQDFSVMSSMSSVSLICIMVSLLSLLGFPMTSGFFSKDLILDFVGLAGGSGLGMTSSVFVGLIGAGYTWNIFFSVSSYESEKVVFDMNKEALMVMPLLVLSLSSLFLGPIFSKYLYPYSSLAISGGVDYLFFMSILCGLFFIDYFSKVYDTVFGCSLLFVDDCCDSVTETACMVSIKTLENMEFGWFEYGGVMKLVEYGGVKKLKILEW
nr:NADH dehydrogenase subunit 5 [Ficopomatus enigmaticus]